MPFQRNGRNVSFEASCAMHLEQPTPADPNVLPMSVATYLPRSQYNYNGICRWDRTGGGSGGRGLSNPCRWTGSKQIQCRSIYVLPDYFVNFICTLPNAKVHIHKPYVCAFYTWLSKYSNFQYYWLVKCKSPRPNCLWKVSFMKNSVSVGNILAAAALSVSWLELNGLIWGCSVYRLCELWLESVAERDSTTGMGSHFLQLFFCISCLSDIGYFFWYFHSNSIQWLLQTNLTTQPRPGNENCAVRILFSICFPAWGQDYCGLITFSDPDKKLRK